MKKRPACFGRRRPLAVVLALLTISAITVGGRAAAAASLAPTVDSAVACVGDCGGDEHVTVDEVVTGVDIALDQPHAFSCDSFTGSGQAPEVAVVTAVSEALTGCPGGDLGTISGTAVKGPVANATVTALAMGSNGMPGAAIGSATTDASGNFTIQMGNYAGPVMLRMTGGSFPDEATGTHMGMGTDQMTTVIPNMNAGTTVTGVHMTVLTSMAQRMAQDMPGGMTLANMTQSNAAVGRYFDVSDILGVHPMDPTASGSGATATQDQRNYGMTLAAMSEYAHTVIGMPSASGMVTAMMTDASDGIMNGMMGGTPINMAGMGGMMGGMMMMQPDACTSGLASAMTSFMQSAQNKSGLTPQDMQALINKLAASNGVIQ